VKTSFEKTFLIILIAGLILLALLLFGTTGLPQPLLALRILLGVAFVLLIPGYALQAAIFPAPRDLDALSRAALSFGLSIAVIPPIFLVLATLGFRFELWTIAPAFFFFILTCATVAVFRHRRRREKEKPDEVQSTNIRSWWIALDRVSRTVIIVLGISMTMAAVTGVIVSQEKPSNRFTEFYLLDSQNSSMDYPREITAGKEAQIYFGVTNHEGGANEYRVVVVGSENQALASTETVLLADGETWKGRVTIRLEQTGNGQLVEFFLERIGSPWPYRTLRIWMNVNPEEEPSSDESASRLPADGGGLPGEEGWARSLPHIVHWVVPPENRVL